MRGFGFDFMRDRVKSLPTPLVHPKTLQNEVRADNNGCKVLMVHLVLVD